MAAVGQVRGVGPREQRGALIDQAIGHVRLAARFMGESRLESADEQHKLALAALDEARRIERGAAEAAA